MELIITEKYNAAEKISNILSGGSPGRERVSGVPVFKWRGKRCIGLAGHVVEIDFNEEYNNWNAVHPSTLIDAPIEKRASKKDIVSAITQLATEVDSVVIATDYDREGELIGKEAYEIVKENNPDVTMQRALFSSLTAPDVERAFDSLEELDFNLAAAGEARQEIDLRWGASLTRFLTLAANRGDGVISVGRVQTPTLKLLVDRDREITNFDPDSYWEIYATFRDPPHGDPFQAQYYYFNEDNNQADRVWDETKAKRIHNTVDNAFKATVDSVEETRRNDNPPVPFSTTEFIKAANAIGFDAKPAMSIAEDLYDEGYITYPRTDNTVYSDDLDIESVLHALTDFTRFENEVMALLAKEELDPVEGDSETTDHPPIHPTISTPSRADLTESEWEIYELVVRRFFATFADPAVWKRTRVDIDVDSHLFTTSGKHLVENGYHAFYPYFDTDESSVPELVEGDMLQVGGTELEAKETQPPNRYGQSKLIEKMKSLQLGTKSTRHNTIDKLYDRGYVTGNPPEPTELAHALISAVESYAEPVATVDMTSQLESDMTAIADGDESLADVTSESCRMLRTVFADLEGAENAIREEMQKHVSTPEDMQPSEEDAIGECPECGGLLIPRSAENGSNFIGCHSYPDCEYTLPLPNKGRVHLLDEVCETHSLQKVKMIAGSATHVFGCPACKQQESEETDDVVLGSCPECDAGSLAIKRVQTGSRLAGCTAYPDCEYALPLPREGEIEVLDEVCAEHELPKIVVVKEEYDSPWELGCPICNYSNM